MIDVENDEGSAPSAPIPENQKDPWKISADFITRLQEEFGIFFTNVGQFFSFPLTQAIDHDNGSDNESEEIGDAVGFFASVGAPIVWLIGEKKLKKYSVIQRLLSKGINPWYRRFKTGFALGNDFGQMAGNFIPLPHHIPLLELARSVLSTLLGSVVGLFVGVGTMVVFSTNPPEAIEKRYKQIYMVGQREGWTKYAKTGLVFGSNLGGFIGTIIGLFVAGPAGAALGYLIGAAVGGVIGFFAAAAGVPLINKVSDGALTKIEEGRYRSNYVRAGIAILGALGFFIGAALGTFVFPGIGTLTMGSLFSAGFAVCGGMLCAAAGPKISQWFDPEKKGANSWDYVLRTAVFFGGNMGLSPVLGLINKVGTLITASVTFALGICAFAIEYYRTHTTKAYDNSHDLPWTQRTASGAVVGAELGNFIGFVLNFTPLGKVYNGAIAIFTSFFAILGAAVTFLADRGMWQKKTMATETTSTPQHKITPTAQPETKKRFLKKTIFSKKKYVFERSSLSNRNPNAFFKPATSKLTCNRRQNPISSRTNLRVS